MGHESGISTPLVSIIVPCYNNAPFLRKCIDSLLSQSYRNIEVVVVDDGSTDGSISQIDGIDDIRLAKPIKIDRAGVSIARNVGIEQAKGEYIVFVDGDDWVEPNHINDLVGGLYDADCAMILMQIDYPDSHEVNDEHRDLFSHMHFIAKDKFNLLFESYLLSSPCNKIYRSSLLKGKNYLRFDGSISYAEDLLFNLEYFKKINSVSLVHAVTYHYVKHSTSSTGRFHQNTVYTIESVTKAVSSLFSPLSAETQRILLRHFLWAIINLFHNNSELTRKQRQSQIACLIHNPVYCMSMSQIDNIGLSSGMKLMLKTANPFIISILLSQKLRR